MAGYSSSLQSQNDCCSSVMSSLHCKSKKRLGTSIAILHWENVLGCMDQKGKLAIYSWVAQARHELEPFLVSVSTLAWDFNRPCTYL